MGYQRSLEDPAVLFRFVQQAIANRCFWPGRYPRSLAPGSSQRYGHFTPSRWRRRPGVIELSAKERNTLFRFSLGYSGNGNWTTHSHWKTFTSILTHSMKEAPSFVFVSCDARGSFFLPRRKRSTRVTRNNTNEALARRPPKTKECQ